MEFVKGADFQGYKVLEVRGGTAAHLKLKENDVITQVGDSVFASDAEFLQHFYTYRPGNPIKLTIRRGSKTLSLKGTVVL